MKPSLNLKRTTWPRGASFALAAAILETVTIATSHAVDFTYITNNGVLTITGYVGPGGNVEIPSAIDGLPVTSIGPSAFAGLGNITGVTIPDSVTNLGPAAFFFCTSLANVQIGRGVTQLVPVPGTLGTFMACVGLTRLTIPDTLTNIGDGGFHLGGYIGTFYECTGLTNVTIGKGLAYLGVGTFDYCTSLVGVYFQGDAPGFRADAFGQDTFLLAPATAYYLSGTTGWSSTYAGIPAMLWNPQPQTGDGNFGVTQNAFGFDIVGTAGIPLVVEASTNLEVGSWVALQTCTLTNSTVYFRDPNWTNSPSRVYRVRSP